ncbi:MAG: VCBS repeat-containing protein [Fibrobacterota bacterium]|nr:VCBS repeat-containing protein [Fibrobacterota bacterium]
MFNRQSTRKALLGACLLFIPFDQAHAQTAGPVSFRKVKLNPQFYSEGIHYADLNKDGVKDIIAGPYWYPGPAFTQKLSFRQPRAAPFALTGDSDCYSIFPWDFNGDGWTDILSMRLPGGVEAVWYENNKGAQGYWTEHIAFSIAQNESAVLTDMDGDGKPELATNSNGFGGWASPDWTDPNAPWTFRNVTAKGTWGAFTHGFGTGDVNGDGRRDLLFSTGWWEQPALLSATPWVHHPAAFWGQAAPLEGPGGAQMFAYDVDGDGDNDVITSLQAHGWGLAWFENKNQGADFTRHLIMNTPAENTQYGAAFAQLHAVALADLDGDGLKDIVTGKRKGAHGNGLGSVVDSPAVLYWFRLTRPQGSKPLFEPYQIDSEAGVGTQLIVEDVDGNGSPDILTARREGAFVFFNQQPFTFLFRPGPGHPGRGASNTPSTKRPTFWRFPEWDALGRTHLRIPPNLP